MQEEYRKKLRSYKASEESKHLTRKDNIRKTTIRLLQQVLKAHIRLHHRRVLKF